jgi:hypothetical protein
VILLSGCLADLAVIEDVGLEEAALAEEDAAILETGAMELRAGRLVATDEAALNSQLGKIRLSRIAGENPKLFIEGRARPWGEIIPERGKIRLIDYNKEFSISDKLFRIVDEKIYVRAAASNTSKIISSLQKDDIIVKLGEIDNWYQVQIIEKNNAPIGFIKASSLLVPLAIAKGKNKSKENGVNDNNSHERYRSYKGIQLSQSNEYLKMSLISFEVTGNNVHIVLNFKNISHNKWLAVALKSEGSEGIADYWKFIPIPRGNVRDNLGNEFGISNISGLGFAKTSDDWSLIKYEESIYADLLLSSNQAAEIGDSFAFSLEIWLAWRDYNNVERKKPIVLYMSNIKPN